MMLFKFIAAMNHHHHLRVHYELTKNDQLPVVLIAQLVEHCTGIAEVMGSNPVQAWVFSGFLSLLLKQR